MTKKSLLPVLLVPSCLVLIPAFAMAFKVEGWAWSGADFVIAWLLIGGTVLAYQFVAAKVVTAAYRAGAGLGLVTGLFLLWVNGAVGLIGSEQNPANRLYAGVLAVGAIGAVIGRLEPFGMARALFATALAQFLVPVVAVVVWPSDFSPGVAFVFALNFCFVLSFVAAGVLFRLAATPRNTTSAHA